MRIGDGSCPYYRGLEFAHAHSFVFGIWIWYTFYFVSHFNSILTYPKKNSILAYQEEITQKKVIDVLDIWIQLIRISSG